MPIVLFIILTDQPLKATVHAYKFLSAFQLIRGINYK